MTDERQRRNADCELPYLGEGWLAAADAAVAVMQPLAAALRVGYRVTDCPPDGAMTNNHTLVLGPDRVGIAAGLDDPTVTFTMAWDVAVAIAKGDTSAQRAFLDGLALLSGQPGALLGHQAELSAVDDLLAAVRARTLY